MLNHSEPVDVVGQNDVVVWEKLAKLSADGLAVPGDGLPREDRPGLLFSGRIPDQTGCSADQRDRMMSGLLEPAHAHHGKKVADVETVSCRIKANVIGDRALG